MKLRKKLISAGMVAALAVGSMSASAAVFNDFEIDPDSTAGGLTVTADKITGNYVEVVTFTPTTATTGTFATSILWEAGQFVQNDGTSGIPGGISGLGNDYLMYAFLEGTGTYATSGVATNFTFDIGGSLEVYLDSDLSSFGNFVAPATGDLAWTLPGANDTLLATGALFAGNGVLDPGLASCSGGINCGSFGTATSFSLTGDGSDFFVGPIPFYNAAFQSGQLNSFVVAGTQTINGSLDVVFADVPEPSSIALMGIAMLGVGGLRRRKRA